MSIQKIINRVPIMVDFEIGGILFRTQEKNLQRAPESLLVCFIVSNNSQFILKKRVFSLALFALI
jgi:hypothetical protein